MMTALDRAAVVAGLLLVATGGCDDSAVGGPSDARVVDFLPLIDVFGGEQGAVDQSLDQQPDQGPPCNDGVQQSGEACDEGPLNSMLPDAPCRPDCTLPRCGDEVIDSDEQCDDGVGNGSGPAASCDLDCRLTARAGLVAHPSQLHFGAFGLTCDGPRVIDLRLVNPTTVAIDLAGVASIGCSGEVQLPASHAATIPPDGSEVVAVTFDPQQQGLTSCALRVRTANPDAELRLPLTAQVSPANAQVDRFLQQLNRKVDVLLVVDPTGSMVDERQRMADTAPAFFAAASAAQLDFHLGSISISPDSPDWMGALHGEPPYLDAQTPDLADEFAERLEMVSGGRLETGFDAIVLALSPPLNAVIDATSCDSCLPPSRCEAGACFGRNHGFRRGDASIEILAFSDEDDGSTSSTGELLGFLRREVNPLAGTFVRVHGLLPGASCTDPEPVPRWTAVIDATGGELHDLCAASYVPAVQAIADRSFGLQDHFPLSRTPEPATIVVTVDGQTTSGPSYDDQANAVIFATPPSDGARIEVSYTPICN
jgi:hypothetical protein